MGRAVSREGFISHRFAIVTIAILFGASAVGWIATELVPADFAGHAGAYRERWGATAAGLVHLLRLYDPFHSFWYRLALALFFVVLSLCLITRWRQLALASWSPGLPEGAEELRKRELTFDLTWPLFRRDGKPARDPFAHYAEKYGRTERIDPERLRERFGRIASVLRSRGLAVVSRESDRGIAFAASAGRWRSPGTMLFHIGIVVITIGGIVGSFAGWRASLFVREGDRAPLPRDSTLSVRVDDFAIETTKALEVRKFVSTISILDRAGRVVKSGAVEVNHPFRVGERRIYQSEFTTDENTFARARIGYALRGEPRRGVVDLLPGAAAAIDTAGITVKGVRLLPDFRMSPEGPYSASAFPANPALEVEVAEGGSSEKGWLFLYHGDFNTPFGAPVDLTLEGVDPVYYTGLEVSANPGARALFAGFALATVGLLLMYFGNPRVIQGLAGPEGVTVAAVRYRWKASFEREFASLREALRAETSTGA